VVLGWVGVVRMNMGQDYGKNQTRNRDKARSIERRWHYISKKIVK
jgi:hypothetical protein